MPKQLVTVDHRQRQESLEATDPCDFGPAESLQLSSQNPQKKAETVRALQLSAQIILQPHQRLVEDLP